MKDLLTELLGNQGGSEWILAVSWQSVSLALGTATICGLIIYFLYRFFFRGAFYNDNFNALLVLATVITALIITTVSANLALSLGMVGALSIVRFRAAIKDPLDAGFIFYAIGAGITAGAGLYLVALLGTVVVALLYLGLYCLKRGRRSYLLMVKYSEATDGSVQKVLAKQRYVLKNRTFNAGEVELTLEVEERGDFSGKLEKIKGVKSVVLVEFNGDYLG